VRYESSQKGASADPSFADSAISCKNFVKQRSRNSAKIRIESTKIQIGVEARQVYLLDCFVWRFKKDLITLTMMLFLLFLASIHSAWSRHDSSISENAAGNTVHTVPLGSEATFHWRCDSRDRSPLLFVYRKEYNFSYFGTCL